MTETNWNTLNCFVWRTDRHGTAITDHNSLFLDHRSFHLFEMLQDILDIGGWISHRMTCISTQKPKWRKMAPSVILSLLLGENIFMKNKHLSSSFPFISEHFFTTWVVQLCNYMIYCGVCVKTRSLHSNKNSIFWIWLYTQKVYHTQKLFWRIIIACLSGWHS